jgi:LEA14-like dessication related protein
MQTLNRNAGRSFRGSRRGIGFRCAVSIALLFLGVVSCKQPEAPEYYGFRDLQIGAATGSQTTVSTVVKLYNPNPYNLELRRAEVDVAINGQHAGHSVLDSTIHIPRRDTFYVPIAMQVDLRAIMSNALQALLSREATISLDGHVKVRKGMLTFNRPFHYDGKQDLNALFQQGF